MPNWENLGIAGAILFVFFILANKIIDTMNKQSNKAIEELCCKINNFTEVNQDLIKVLSTTMIIFEKDQKEIMTNINQILDIVISLSKNVCKIEERTKSKVR